MDQSSVHHRTMKDFMEMLNKMVDQCFDKCISNFNHFKSTDRELHCVNTCSDKGINFSQRHMMVFVEYQQTQQKMAARAAAEAQASVAADAATSNTPATPTTTPPMPATPMVPVSAGAPAPPDSVSQPPAQAAKPSSLEGAETVGVAT